MEPIRWWCEAHDRSSLDNPDKFGVAVGWCAVGSADRMELVDGSPCSPVFLIPSRDGSGRLLGLLAADKCQGCEGSGCRYGYQEDEDDSDSPPCDKCDGSGYTLRAKVSDWGGLAQKQAVLPVERSGQ